MTDELILLSKRVAQLRIKRGLTQDKLAELTNYSTNHIAKLESARTKPSFDVMVAIAKALKVEIKELFSYEEQKSLEYIKNEFQKIINNSDTETLKILYKFYGALFN